MKRLPFPVLWLVGVLLMGSAALAEAVTITRVSAPVFYMDDKDDFYGTYVGYRVTNTGATDLADVWVDIGSFTGVSVGLSPLEDGLVRLGNLPAGTSKTAFFYLSATGEATGEQHTVTVYDGAPLAPVLAAQTYSLDVRNEQGANANHVSTVVHGPDPPGLGGILTVTVTGATGVMTGNPKVLAFTPAARLDWPASSFQLISTSITLTGGNPGVMQDELYREVTSKNTSDYVAEYRFKVVNTTTAEATVSPTVYVTSGGNIKHNGNTDYSLIQPVGIAQNRLSVGKSVTPGQLASADTVEYAVTLFSADDSLTVIDDIVDVLPSSPAAVSYVPGSSSLDGAAHPDPAVSGNTLTWTGPFDLSAMGTRTLRFRAVIGGVPGSYVNRAVAHVGETQIDTTPATGDDAPATATVGVGSADLEMAKSVLPATAAEYDTVVYTVTIDNQGPQTATGVEVQDLLPAGLQFVAALATTGAYDDSTGVWNVGTVASGSGATLTLEAVVQVGTAGSTITNTALILASDFADPDSTDDNASVSLVPLRGGPDLSLVGKVHSPDTLVAGAAASWVLTVTNAGPPAVDSLIVLDQLPPEVLNPVFTPSLGTYDAGSGLWTGLVLAVGDTATLTVAGQIDPAATGPLINTATVQTSAGDYDPAPGNNAAADTAAVVRSADLQLSKTVSSATPAEGDTVRYTVAVANAGPSAAAGIEVQDMLPNGVTLVGSSATQGAFDPGAGVWDTLSVAPGAADSLWLDVRVDPGTAGTTITNSASVVATDAPDPDTATNTAQVDITPAVLGSISGYVYADADHDAARTGAEAGTGLVWFVKLVDSGAPGGPALAAAAVDPVTGVYTLSVVSAGSYTLVLDDNGTLADVAPAGHAEWTATEAAGGTRPGVLVADVPVVNQNFGLFHGGRVTGTVFIDTGAGGATLGLYCLPGP